MTTLLKNSLTLILGLLFISGSALAQQQQMPPQPKPLSPEEVSDQDLQMVANVSKAAEGIQQEANSRMKKVLEDEGMQFSRFQQIMMAMQNPQMSQQVDVTEEEQKTIQTVQPNLQKINNEARSKYVKAIQDEGLTPQKFQQLALTIQTHQEVADRFEEISAEGDSQ
ncbi:DUF4168 domain-containing protein [Gracilimonas tropica]|uniref:DUF4168 domain-containing protein n=1 Tax=Gracilimonas tropica TaxID=454600 RepID=UPI00037A1B87|nr:DUF4168 domain-containing protein [Gracilimonas tropica]